MGSHKQPGDEDIAETLASYGGLVICGHARWEQPLALRGAMQIVCVDGRAVMFER